MTLAAAGLLSCTGTGQSAFDPASVADASGEVTRVEPLSWWTGMQTPLQLLVNGAGIAAYDVRIEGGQGVGVKARHKADSPNYLFVDVKVKPDAEPGSYSRRGNGSSRFPMRSRHAPKARPHARVSPRPT